MAKHDGITSKSNGKTVGGGKIMHGDPEGSNTHIWPIIGIVQIPYLDHLIMQSNHKYTFRTKHNGIYSKLMIKR